MSNNKILFIGTYAEGEYLRKLLKTGEYQQLAANQTENLYISELAIQTKEIKVLSALVLSSFPRSKIMYVRHHFEEFGSFTVENIGFLNLPIIRFFSQTMQLCLAAHKSKSIVQDENLIVIVYSMRLPYFIATKYIRLLNHNAICVNIVPDIPKYMHTEKESIWIKMKSNFNHIILNHLSSFFDGFVLYAKAMKNVMKFENSIVIEGIVDAVVHSELCPDNKRIIEGEKQIIMYAGGLNERYGIANLVKGFKLANIKNTELHLYGSGDYVPKIKIISLEDDRIKFHGFYSSEAIRKEMYNASLLVNPRPTNEEYTRFSCPSKTLECMRSGVPFLSTKLKGIPDDYFNFIYSIEDETPEGIATSLKYVFSIPFSKRVERARKAAQFVLNEKNATKQVYKLLSFVRELKENK